LDEDAFMRQFEDVPTVQLFSCRDMEENMNQLRSVIEDMSKDWAKRVEAVSAK
jgi:CLIP-associating protein 1/2